jgi:hypothetical protein
MLTWWKSTKKEDETVNVASSGSTTPAAISTAKSTIPKLFCTYCKKKNHPEDK